MPSDEKVPEGTYEINSLPLGPCLCPPLELQAAVLPPEDNKDKFLDLPHSHSGTGTVGVLFPFYR